MIGKGLAVIGGIIALVVIAVVLTLGGVAWGWFSGEASLRSFNHVRTTYAEAYDDVGALKALRVSACNVKGEMAQESDPYARSQLRDQLNAFVNRYASIQNSYQAYMDDHFRGKLYHPKDLPLPYPDLDLSTCKG